MWPNERKKERGGKEKKLKSTYLVRLNIKLIKRHKCGPRRFPDERRAEWRGKRRSTCSSAFSVAGIAFAFFVVVFFECACARARGGVWLSLILRGRRGSWWWVVGILLSVHKCPPPSLCCLTFTGFTKLWGGVCLSTRR